MGSPYDAGAHARIQIRIIRVDVRDANAGDDYGRKAPREREDHAADR